MSTTFISRGKAALVCCVAAVALAFGMAAVATADAHAVTVKNGAKYQTVHFMEPVVFDVDGDKNKDTVVFSWDKTSGKVCLNVNDEWGTSIQTTIGCELNFDTNGHFEGYAHRSDFDDILTESDPDTYIMRLITLKNGKVFLYLKSKQTVDPYEYDWWCSQESLVNIWTEKSVDVSAYHYCAKSASITKVDGNSIYFKYTQRDPYDDDEDNPTGGTFKTYYTITFPLKYTYSSTVSNLKLSSTSATPTKTTTWRKVGPFTAYKYSSCKTYKFKIKDNAKVQLKKVSVKYAPYPLRYYVKTTAGKYGWIYGTDYLRGGA